MNSVLFSKESVAEAVTEDVVNSVNKEARPDLSIPEPAFHRGNPDVVLALSELESDITVRLPSTDKFNSLVKKVLSLNTYQAIDFLLAVAIDGEGRYSKAERLAATSIFNRLGDVRYINSCLEYRLRRDGATSI